MYSELFICIRKTALKSVLARVSKTRRTRICLAALPTIEAQRHTFMVGTESADPSAEPSATFVK